MRRPREKRARGIHVCPLIDADSQPVHQLTAKPPVTKANPAPLKGRISASASGCSGRLRR